MNYTDPGDEQPEQLELLDGDDWLDNEYAHYCDLTADPDCEACQ